MNPKCQDAQAQGPTEETRIRARTRVPLIKIAAECHTKKWQFDHDDENGRLPAAEARRLVRAAFDALHNIGDMAHKAAEALMGPETVSQSPAAAGPAKCGAAHLNELDQIAFDLEEWIRHPDWAETFPLDDMAKWVNERPVHIVQKLREISARAPAAAGPAQEANASLRDAVDRIIVSAMAWQPSENGPSYDGKFHELMASFDAAARTANIDLDLDAALYRADKAEAEAKRLAALVEVAQKDAAPLTQLKLAEESTSDEVTRRHLREIISRLCK